MSTLQADHKIDGCQLVKMDTTSEAVAEAFEVFTQHLEPWGTTATLNHTFHQLECFERAQVKFSLGEVPMGDAALLPHPAITRYLKLLEKRLHISLIRFYLLNDMIMIPPVTDHPSSAHG